MFTCPRCRRRLVQTRTEHGIFFVCPGCGGRAVSLSVVRRMAGPDPARRLWSAANGGEAQPGVGCPICRRSMAQVPLPVDGEQVPLDVCTGCQFVWFDPAELEKLPKAPPEPSEKKPLPQEAREKIAIAEAEAVGKRAGRDDDPLTGPEETWKWIPGLFGMPVECGVAPVSHLPWITWGLAAILVAVFAVTQGHLADLVVQYGLIPAEIWPDRVYTLATSFFLHAGLAHLIANGYFLVVFGDNVEDYLGRWRYLLLLAASALAGDLTHVLGDPRSTLPCIGASGGISGMITFYALRFPEARLGILLRYLLIFRWLYMPAWVALILWFVLQFVLAVLQVTGASEVSALAHLGGAAVGVAAWVAWRRK
jgi:membrane associated rhomboid family serine protease